MKTQVAKGNKNATFARDSFTRQGRPARLFNCCVPARDVQARRIKGSSRQKKMKTGE
jgi:hypothetical protein